MSEKIFKIVSRAQWETAQSTGVFAGAEIDLVDGYIHFSTFNQVAETAEKHFTGATDLLLVVADSRAFGDSLKWEPSRGGELFPHLYHELNLKEVEAVHEFPLGADGKHVLPKLD